MRSMICPLGRRVKWISVPHPIRFVTTTAMAKTAVTTPSLTPVPDPEVAVKPTRRRRFTAEYELQVLREGSAGR